jgi:hypothetical protein
VPRSPTTLPHSERSRESTTSERRNLRRPRCALSTKPPQADA